MIGKRGNKFWVCEYFSFTHLLPYLTAASINIILPWVEESRSQAAKAQVLSSLPVQLYKQQEQEFCQDTHQENEATTAGNTLVKLQAMQ